MISYNNNLLSVSTKVPSFRSVQREETGEGREDEEGKGEVPCASVSEQVEGVHAVFAIIKANILIGFVTTFEYFSIKVRLIPAVNVRQIGGDEATVPYLLDLLAPPGLWKLLNVYDF